MTNSTDTALDRFVRATRALFEREPDPEVRWTAMTPILAEFLADPDVVEASKAWPDCVHRDNRAENLLFYEDPDHKFAINGLVIAGGEGRGRIHDHAHIYTLYGVLDGRQRIERFERVDDRTKPDYAEIRPTADSVCGPGEIDLVRPFEVHCEHNIGERAVALIIRSEKSGGFNQGRYLPETNGYYESLGPRQTPWDIFNRTPVAGRVVAHGA
jgi:predicted metal-dependent enzyme (double-stranded beta helix superfamily)